ncbi:MAG: sodium:solute symporter family protein [Betaproteobacteria bacterium]
MLIWFVVLYITVSVGIGLYASRRVKNTADYVVAGHHLPLPFIIATVFATWFGSETVLGIPAKFMAEGLQGVIADPFGSSMCLILVGLFFARPLYRMKLLTIGDYYRTRYGRSIELAASLCIVASYLGWVSAQITALGLVFSVITHGAIEPWQGMAIGTAIVLLYTLAGGMFSVAFTDLFQMCVILLGMIYIAFVVSGIAGGAGVVIEHAAAASKFEFLPAFEPRAMIAFLAAWITMGFGSIPQQDVFQRVSAAKDEQTAGRGSVIGGCVYFVFAFIPIYLAYSAILIDPALVNNHINSDSQYILPNLILQHTPLAAQAIFFGALLAAIMSCSSATLLAPSVTFAENVLRPFLPKLADWQFLRLLRWIVLLFAICVFSFALGSGATIYGMVENAYKITLVAAFAPLAFGLYWKRATTQGAACAMALGLGVWISCELMIGYGVLPPDPLLPAQFAGWLASIIGMLAGSLLPQWYCAPQHPSTA